VTPLDNTNSDNSDNFGFLKKKYLKPSFRFPRVKTAVLSARLILPGGYSFQIHYFIQALQDEDLRIIPRMLENHAFQFTGTDAMIELIDCGIIYLPKTHMFSLRMDPTKPSIHLIGVKFFDSVVLAAHHELSEPLANTKCDRFEKLKDLIVAMVRGFIDNLPGPDPQEEPDIQRNYKHARADYYKTIGGEQAYQLLLETYGSYHLGGRLLIGDITPYHPGCTDSKKWMAAALFDARELVYSLLGAYFLLELTVFTLIGTIPIIILSVLRRWLVLHAKLMEKNAKNKDGRFQSRLLQARQGMSCAMLCLIKDCKPCDFYSALMHYAAYSKRRYWLYVAEDILIWIAYFNGLRIIMGGQATVIIGVVLGIISFLLRHLLESSSCASRGCEVVSRFLVSLFYAVCYGAKDLIALHYALSFTPDFFHALNGTLSNRTWSELINASNPWSDHSFNETFHLPLLDAWSEKQRIAFLAGIIFLDLSYYILMNSRSSRRDNPPGSKQSGFTGLVDVLGLMSILFFIPWDLFFMGMQSAEMLFALETLTQMLYGFHLLSQTSLFLFTFTVVPMVAVVSGFLYAAINLSVGCQLCCKTAEPWLRRAEKALNSRSDAKQSLLEVGYAMLRASIDCNQYTVEEFLNFLKNFGKPGLEVMLFLQTMAVKAENWKTFKAIVQTYMPLLHGFNDEKWLDLYQKSLKITPQIDLKTIEHSSDSPSSPGAGRQKMLGWLRATGNSSEYCRENGENGENACAV
jgi:hypothetical protein